MLYNVELKIAKITKEKKQHFKIPESAGDALMAPSIYMMMSMTVSYCQVSPRICHIQKSFYSIRKIMFILTDVRLDVGVRNDQ